MHAKRHSIPIVTRTLENEAFLSEALMLPDRVFFADSLQRARIAAMNLGRRHVEDLAEDGIATTPFPSETEMASVQVTVEPPVKSNAWEDPVLLRFDIVRWMHGDAMAVAYVPSLGIVVLAEKPEDLESRVVAHIRFALFRNEQAKSLWLLAQTQRTVRTDVSPSSVKLRLDSPKQRLKEEAESREVDSTATLRAVSKDLGSIWHPRVYEAESLVRRVGEALTGARGGSVLLVGPSGVGKTAVVHQLVAERALHGLGGRPFYGTSGSRLIAGMGGFGMWQERMRTICREAEKARAVLHLGGIVELLEVGRSIHNDVGMASFLRPYLIKGSLTAIAECTPEEIPVIERQDAHLLQAFQRIDVEEPDETRGRDILLSVAIEGSIGRRDAITAEAVDLLDRLHRRYATYSAYPGRPIRFMRNLLKDLQDDAVVDTRMVLQSFSRETGIPMAILDEAEPLDLTATLQWFENRVMGQTEAVRQAVDLLAVVKSRLARPRKPLASLLFAGPTGVGKTEMAKALAEFLFGDKDRLVRFDMSEYADPAGAARLIGGTADGEGQLTGKLREQPFSVVLLDEFEKAHPATYDLLLQVMGEGRLTDVRGRVADFRNAVIIMTSNLGAASYQKGTPGFVDARDVRDEARDHFTSAVRKFLRPEMFNRIDAIVAFAPLDRETVLRIAKRELSLIARRDGIRLRGVSLLLADSVADLLAEKGFDARYGARPLKRAAEDRIVTPLACGLNRYTDDIPLVASIEVTNGDLAVDVSAHKDDSRAQEKDAITERMIRELAEQCATARRWGHAIATSVPVTEIENDVYRLERLERKAKARQFSRGLPPPAELQELPALRALVKEIKDFRDATIANEEHFQLAYYQKEEIDVSRYRATLSRLTGVLDGLALRLYARQFSAPHRVLLAVYSEERARMARLAESYARIVADIAGSRITARWVGVSHDRATKKRLLTFADIETVAIVAEADACQKPSGSSGSTLVGRLVDPPAGVIGVVMAIEGDMVYPLLSGEEGVHIFKEKDKSEKCLVHASDADAKDYVAPRGIERSGGMAGFRLRRTYDADKSKVTDASTQRAEDYAPNRLTDFLQEALERGLKERAYELFQGGRLT